MGLWQVQNLGRANFFQKPHNPFRVGSQNLVIKQVFINFRVQKSEFFCKYATSCSLFHRILHFLSKLIKNILAKFSSHLNLMTGQNLTPENLMPAYLYLTLLEICPPPYPLHVCRIASIFCIVYKFLFEL